MKASVSVALSRGTVYYTVQVVLTFESVLMKLVSVTIESERHRVVLTVPRWTSLCQDAVCFRQYCTSCVCFEFQVFLELALSR